MFELKSWYRDVPFKFIKKGHSDKKKSKLDMKIYIVEKGKC